MSTVIKQNGKFVLLPDPVIVAKEKSSEDLGKTKSKLTDDELRAILSNILIRLSALDGQV